MRPEFGDGRPSGTVAEYFAVSPQRFSLRSDKLQISIVLSSRYKNKATLTRDEILWIPDPTLPDRTVPKHPQRSSRAPLTRFSGRPRPLIIDESYGT